MKKTIQLLMVISILHSHSIFGLDAWKSPNPKLRYDQASYLMSHNSFANVEEGFIYAQQFWSMEKQLANGVRGFMLDFWIDKEDTVAKLCHSDCKTSKWLKAGRKHREVLDALKMIKKWLDAHPKEILTLDLENYLTEDNTYQLIKNAQLLDLLLTTKDWDPDKHNGLWPTLQWMQDNKKRLVIFDTKGFSLYAYNIAHHMIRNMYGSLDMKKAAKIRGSVPSPKPYIFELNYFGISPLALHNRPKTLKKLLGKIQSEGYLRPGQMPNFIAINNVHLGNAMEWVNELNKKATAKLK